MTTYSERKGLIKYQVNNLTEEEIQEAITDYKKRAHKVETIVSESGTRVSYRCKRTISKEDSDFAIALAKKEGKLEVDTVYRVAAIYGLL